MEPVRRRWLATLRAAAICCCLAVVRPTAGLHLTGEWHSRDFFKFLAKFGFQQANVHEYTDTQGYIYGNVTSSSNVSRPISLVVVDAEYFLFYFGNRSTLPRTAACQRMFTRIDDIAWDERCHPDGQQDFIRHVPCATSALCMDETDPRSVLPGYQFTYHVRDTNQPRFWYVSLVACHRNSSCVWMYDTLGPDIVLKYDIWLVNGLPDKKHNNPLEHQFSFEMHDTVELYAAFAVAYMLLLPVQLYAALGIQRHALPLLLAACMALEFVGVLLNVAHVVKFAFDGTGAAALRVAGNFMDTASQCLFMLLLLLVVKGWTITHVHLECHTKLVLFIVWAAYTAASVALFIWNQMDVDLISDIDEWQTWPGWLILAFRLVIMLWFLWELRETFRLERNESKTRFYLHFGAGFLVWFVYLPLLTLICSHVSSLWRYKFIISVSYSADFLSLCVLVHLLWPSRSYLVFNLNRHESSRISIEGLDFTGMTLLRGIGETDDDDYEGSSDVDLYVRQDTRPVTRTNNSMNQPQGLNSFSHRH